MSYTQWFNKHADKHRKIVEKLLEKNATQEEIIAYFDFENMKVQERDFCPLYAKNQKCHEIKELNCYLCACPNFRFKDEGIQKIGNDTQYSFCAIDSKDGAQGNYGGNIHQNCSACFVPHTQEYVKKHFDTDWRKIMDKVKL